MSTRVKLTKVYTGNFIITLLLGLPLIILFEYILKADVGTVLDYIIYIGMILILFNQRCIMEDRDQEWEERQQGSQG